MPGDPGLVYSNPVYIGMAQAAAAADIRDLPVPTQRDAAGTPAVTLPGGSCCPRWHSRTRCAALSRIRQNASWPHLLLLGTGVALCVMAALVGLLLVRIGNGTRLSPADETGTEIEAGGTTTAQPGRTVTVYPGRWGKDGSNASTASDTTTSEQHPEASSTEHTSFLPTISTPRTHKPATSPTTATVSTVSPSTGAGSTEGMMGAKTTIVTTATRGSSMSSKVVTRDDLPTSVGRPTVTLPSSVEAETTDVSLVTGTPPEATVQTRWCHQLDGLERARCTLGKYALGVDASEWRCVSGQPVSSFVPPFTRLTDSTASLADKNVPPEDLKSLAPMAKQNQRLRRLVLSNCSLANDDIDAVLELVTASVSLVQLE